MPEPGRLRDALARALRDPSLELAYWVPESGPMSASTASPSSRPRPRVERSPCSSATASAIAALVHDAALAEDPALLEAVSRPRRLALENERLLAELRAQLDQLRQSRARIVEAGDTERRRLERNLHDGAQQRLVSPRAGAGAGGVEGRAGARRGGELLQAAREELTEALAELRELARGIHPAVLTERGLPYALETLAERAPVAVELDRAARSAAARRRSRRPPTTS